MHTEKPMELRQLRYFVAVADSGSFTAAASRLNIVQSALSRQISNLEAELGVALFYREGRSVRLAPAGEGLKDIVAKILVEVDQLKSRAKEFDTEIAGLVRVGSHHSDGNVLLPRVFEKLQQTYPDVQIDPVQALTSELQEMLIKGRLDLAILTLPDPVAGLDLDPIAREHIYLAGPAGSLPFTGKKCAFREALSVPQVAPHHPHRERAALEEFAKKFGVELQISVEADGLTLMKMLSLQGRGAVILPETALQEEKNDDAWSVLEISDYKLTRYLAKRSALVQSRAAIAVQSLLLQEIEALKNLKIML